jgi:protein required for attachment to host cells
MGDVMRYKTWALVTDGVRARILRDLEDGNSHDPIELVSKAKSTHLRDYLSDKAGRSFASGADGRRSAMEPGSDPVLRDMQDFAQETFSVLEDHFRKGHLTRLAIFAAPKMLGVLRREIPASLKDAVTLERNLNLFNLPEADLRNAVIRALGKEPKT